MLSGILGKMPELSCDELFIAISSVIIIEIFMSLVESIVLQTLF